MAALQLRQGTQAELEVSLFIKGELGFVTDSHRLVVGNDGGSVQRILDLRPYATGKTIKAGDPIYYSGVIYIAASDFTTTNWGADEGNFTPLTRTNAVVRNNIVEMNAISGDALFSGLQCYVLNASFTSATPIISGLDIDTIAWQSGNTVRLTMNGTPDLSGVAAGNIIKVESAGKAVNNGQFVISAVNDGSDYIDITNSNVADATEDEASDSPATAAVADETDFDPTVLSGTALYIYADKGAGLVWNKIAEFESIDVVIQNATESIAGIAELATEAETVAGADDTKIVTPLKLKSRLDTKVDKVSSPTVGNFMGQDDQGNATDSGSNSSSFEAAGAITTHTSVADAHHTNANDPSATQKAALAGADGTPGVGNEYLTKETVASDTKKGIAELATQAEVNAGTETAMIVTPATLKSHLDSSTRARNVVKVRTDANAAITIVSTDHLVRSTYSSTGTVVATMPAISSCVDGQIIGVKDKGIAGTNNVSIVPAGSDSIDESVGEDGNNVFKLTSDREIAWFAADLSDTHWDFIG